MLDERKREMVYRRLMRRTRELRIASFSAYCELLKADDEKEVGNFINAITTNLTSFFREDHHFQYLEKRYIPELIERNSGRRLRIWSAGCSTGEEPYSIAITLRHAMEPHLKAWDAKILATDLDTEVLDTGKAGIYAAARIEGIDENTIRRWFRKGSGSQANKVRVDSRLKQLITFKQLNLLADWPMHGPFDIIFCRNVLIYFDKSTQNILIDRYHQLLKPNGLLFLGHSENLGQHSGRFQALGHTIFRKCEQPQPYKELSV